MVLSELPRSLTLGDRATELIFPASEMPEIMDESLNMLGRYLGGFFWFCFMCPGFVSPHLLSFKMLMLS